MLPNKPESYWVKNEDGMYHVEYKEVDISKLAEECNKKKHLKISASGK